MGYYSRARNLHKTAKILVEKEFPKIPEEWERLPGIGAYTASAICAIAFDHPTLGIDTNVQRVLARIFKLDPKTEKEKLKQAGSSLMNHLPGDLTQAFFDLGAEICTPRTPNCKECPVHKYCLAYKENLQEQYPPKKEKRKKQLVRESLMFTSVQKTEFTFNDVQ